MLGYNHTPVGPGGLNDCAVRAWTISTGLPYEQVLAELQKHDDKVRRRRVDIQQRGTQIAAMRRFAYEHGWLWKDARGHWEGQVYRNPPLAAESLPEGPVVAITTKHAVACQDRVLLDEYDSRANSGELLGWFWKPVK